MRPIRRIPGGRQLLQLRHWKMPKLRNMKTKMKIPDIYQQRPIIRAAKLFTRTMKMMRMKRITLFD